MKKFICLFLCFSFLASIFTVLAYAKNGNEQNDIYSFIKGTQRLIQKYDANKDFDVTSEKIPSKSISDKATMYFSESSVSENETDDVPELDFQTCRLIVQSNKSFNTYNAVDVVSGFKNFYIIQYENEETTKKAYETYLEDADIISVDIDTVQKAFETESSGEENTKAYTQEDFHNCWSLSATGIDIVLENYKTQTFEDVTIGIIDTGIDLDHEIFENRIVRTYFNSCGEGAPDDESDVNGHGTMVASIIAKVTPSNVKIAMYRNGTAKGYTTAAISYAAILKAIEDGIKIINCSFTVYDNEALICEIIKYAYEKGVFISQAAGNSGSDLSLAKASVLNASNYNYVVGSSTNRHLPANSTSYGKSVQVLAPGADVMVATNGNTYDCVGGTSFSSPYVAGIYALLSCINPNYNMSEKRRMISGSVTDIAEKYIKYNFYCGILNCLDLFDLNKEVDTPIFSIDSGIYEGKVVFEIYGETGCDIYYTTDQTYPSPTNGTLYTHPIELEGDYFEYTAVAYKNGYRSDYSKEQIHSATIGTDDMFTINANGTITEYTGNTLYLKIPEIINGIEVKDIAECLFSDVEIHGVILPDTLTFLGDISDFDGSEHKSFLYGNQYVEFVSGENIKLLGDEAFYECISLKEVFFPNAEVIGCYSFYDTKLKGAIFPEVTTLFCYAFSGARKLREIYLPKCEKMLDSAFQECRVLKHIYAPSLDIDTCSIEYPDYVVDISENGYQQFLEMTCLLEKVDFPNLSVLGYWRYKSYKNCFANSSVNRAEFSKIEYIYELPQPGQYYGDYYKPICVELSLPSTLRYCQSVDDFLEEDTRYYVVYGTKHDDSYAAMWAQENNIEFIELTQETAIVEDIESVWDEYSYKTLVFDARGFNRTYQWYGSYDNKASDDDIAINGATTNEFNPNEENSFPYYYCKMISTDINCEGKIIESFDIYSSICENKLYETPKANIAENIVSLVGGTETNSKLITFVAVGSNMNLSQCIEGATKFMPVSWYVNDEIQGDFKNCDYTVTYKHSDIGTYNLIVVFEKFIYAENSWQSTGETDTKIVNYTIKETDSDQSQELYISILELIFKMISALLQIITKIC